MAHKTETNHNSRVRYICESWRNASDPENTGFSSLHKVIKSAHCNKQPYDIQMLSMC
jgi:hypothetical protein